MDYRTAAALSQNIAGIGDAFMQMNDPANRAKAALVGNQNALLASQVEGQGIENRYRPGLFTAQTAAANGSAAQAIAGGKLHDAQTANWGIRNQAGRAALDGFIQVPTTSYSQGGAYGPDEMTDPNTEQGYSSTGRNLSPGVVAVNPSVHPIGTVFQSPDGKTYIAADKHGNKNPNVVDMYRLPQEYKAQSGDQQLRVVGQEKIPYGTTAGQLAEMRAKYERQAGLSNIFNGGGAADLAAGIAQMTALTAQDELDMRRAMGAQGKVMGQGEYFEPGLSTAFQGRALTNNLDQEKLRQSGAMARTVDDNNFKREKEVFDAMTAGVGGRSASSTSGGNYNPFEGAKDIGSAATARFSLDGEKIAENDLPKAQAWATSVSTLTSMNVPFETAKAIADAHHGQSKTEDGWFSGPSKNYDAFNTAPITPEQAAQAAAKYSAGGGAAPDAQRIMSAAQVFGYGSQPVAATAPAQQVAAPAPVVPQTGVDRPPGKAIGTELEKADKQRGVDKGTAYNSGTLGNIMRAAKEEGVSFDDILATVSAGGKSNDHQIARIFATSKGLGVLSGGGRSADDLRNALKDARALEAANLNPEQISSYFRSPGQAQQGQGSVRKYNPATGAIE